MFWLHSERSKPFLGADGPNTSALDFRIKLSLKEFSNANMDPSALDFRVKQSKIVIKCQCVCQCTGL